MENGTKQAAAHLQTDNRFGPRVRLHAAIVYIHHRHLVLLLSEKADIHFTIALKVEV